MRLTGPSDEEKRTKLATKRHVQAAEASINNAIDLALSIGMTSYVAELEAIRSLIARAETYCRTRDGRICSYKDDDVYYS